MQFLTKPIAERAARFASRVVDHESGGSRIGFAPRRAALIGAVTDAIISFLAVRRARFPNRASQLLTRFASDRLPGSTIRALRRTALAILHPAPKPKVVRQRATPKTRVVLSTGGVFVPAGGLCVHRTTEQARAAGYDSVAAWVDSLTLPPASVRRAFINERIDALLAPIRRHAQTYPDARNERCRVAHVALLEQARAQFLASVAQ